MDYSLWASIAALVASLLALARAYVPPQQRQLHQLTGRVEDLEMAHQDVRERLTKRAKTENMAKARDEKESRANTRERIELEALRVLAESRAGATPASQPQPLDEAAQRAQLRARYLVGTVKH